MAKKKYKSQEKNIYDWGGIVGAIGTGLGMIGNLGKLSRGVDTTAWEQRVKNYANTRINPSTPSDLITSWKNRKYLNTLSREDLTGTSRFGEITGLLGNVGSGIAAGYSAGKALDGAGSTGVAGNDDTTVANADAAAEAIKNEKSLGGVLGLIGGGLNLIGGLVGMDATTQKLNKLNRDINYANQRIDKTYADAVNNVADTQYQNLLANYSALGGPLYGFSEGAAAYDIAKDAMYAKELNALSKNGDVFSPAFTADGSQFSDGGSIHIKPSKKGTFTAAATKHGKSVQEFASQVLANPDNYSPAMVKKANFARNAAKWHADGGPLMSDEFTNGVTLIDQGGTHENNPHEGVQMGIAPDGKPNLVEEGEAIYNDYVFSNRLRVPKEVRNKYKLRGPKDMTFAEAFRNAQKESQERPNDSISQDGLEHIAMILARTQEAVRGYEKAQRAKALGGHLFSGLDDPYDELVTNLNKEQDVLAQAQADEVAARERYEAALAQKLKDSNLSWLRAANPLANALAVTTDMMGLTNNPTPYDYIPAFGEIGYSPLGEYVPTTHFDTRYAANQAAQQASATRDALMQSTAPSKWANILAADYNAQIANGELLRRAELDDFDRMIKALEFNRATNQANNQMGLQAAAANQDARLKYAQAALQQAKMNTDETNATMAAKAANLGNLAESIANIGVESDALNWRDMLIRAGAFGTLSEKPYNWSNDEWSAYQKALQDIKSTKTDGSKACGGKIKRRKKGLTY